MSHTRSKNSNVVGTMCKQSGCQNIADKSGMCDECATKQATKQATEIVNAYKAYKDETHPGNKMLPLPEGGYEFKSKRSKKRAKRSNKRSGKRSNKSRNKRKSVRKNKKSLRK